MKRTLLLGLALGCIAVIYLVLLNGESVDVRLSPTWSVHWNVGALIGGAFVAGVLLVLTVVGIQAGQRAFVAWRSGRKQRRSDRIDQWEEHGAQLIWNGEAQRGRALLQKAWQRRPQDAQAVLALAESFREAGELHRARGILFDAVERHHTNPDVLLALAETHRAAGERGPWIESLERLRALHPRSPRALRALRDAYAEVDRWSDASAVQETLIAEIREPQQSQQERDYSTVLRYEAALQLADANERIAILENLASARSAPVPVLVSLGDSLRAAGRIDEASAVWERALRSMPRTVFVDRLAELASDPKHRDRLRTILRKVRSNQLHADNVHLVNARLFLADKNIEEAARELQGVDNAATATPVAQRVWAEVHRQRGQVEQALNAYEQADGANGGYHCSHCEHVSPQWVGLCPQCRKWDSYRAAIEIAS